MPESELRDLEDSVLWLGHAQVPADASQVELRQEVAIHFLVRGGKIIRAEGFLLSRAGGLLANVCSIP
jgi:hypothetical protein